MYDGEQAGVIQARSLDEYEYFPLKDLAKIYGAQYEWKPVSGQVTMTRANQRLSVSARSTRAMLGHTKRRFDMPTRVIGRELYVPAEFLLSDWFASFTGAATQWNDETRFITIERVTSVSPARFYTRPDGSREIVIELAEDLPCRFEEPRLRAVRAIFDRGIARDERQEVNDGAIESITSFMDGRSAVVEIALSTGAAAGEKKYLTRPWRAVIEVTGGSAPSVPVAPIEPDTTGMQVSSDTPENVVSSSVTVCSPAERARARKKKLRVMLDAGHGGDDPGAVGHNGTREKEINLAVIQELAGLMEKDGGYEVRFTRHDDTFIPLVDRTTIANEAKADIFISVHCNASMDRKSGGFEIYFLNENASDPEAAATAMLENSVVELEGAPSASRAKLQQLLWSLTVNEFINESSALCAFIADEVPRRTKIPNRGVKQAGFYVLKGTQMPAVLVECAFLSNYSEEARLNTRRLRAAMADAIFEGLKKYRLRCNGAYGTMPL